MITSTSQIVVFLRSNRTLGIVYLSGFILVLLHVFFLQSAVDLAAKRAYRILPTAPLVVATNLAKVLWGIANLVTAWTLWRMFHQFPIRDGKRWPSIALAVNCGMCSVSCFFDVAVIFFPVFLVRVAVVQLAAWTALFTAILFRDWLQQHKVEINKE